MQNGKRAYRKELEEARERQLLSVSPPCSPTTHPFPPWEPCSTLGYSQLSIQPIHRYSIKRLCSKIHLLTTVFHSYNLDTHRRLGKTCPPAHTSGKSQLPIQMKERRSLRKKMVFKQGDGDEAEHGPKSPALFAKKEQIREDIQPMKQEGEQSLRIGDSLTAASVDWERTNFQLSVLRPKRQVGGKLAIMIENAQIETSGNISCSRERCI